IDLRPRSLRKLSMAGDEVGMQVCLDDVPDGQALALRLLEILVDVAARIDDRGFSLRSDHVGGLSQTTKIKLFDEHRLFLPEDPASVRRLRIRGPERCRADPAFE